MNKTLSRYLFLAFALLCATVLTAITKDAGYFGYTLFGALVVAFIGLIADAN